MATPSRASPRKPAPSSSDDDFLPITLNVTINNVTDEDAIGRRLARIEEQIMALRDDVAAGLEEVRTSIVTLADAITAGDARDAAKIAELEAVIVTLQANDTVDAETIASLQAVVDGMNADSDTAAAALNDVNASIDTLIAAQPQP